MSDKKIETRILTKEEVESLGRKSRQNWRDRIIKYMTSDNCKNNGKDAIAIYNATRPDRLDISNTKKKHNVASQLTYLRDDGIYLKNDDDSKIVIIANKKMEVYPGAEKWL